jgi:hypothetical protein
MTEESNLSKCSCCQEIKPRIQNGKYPDNINKLWIDENGKKWVGRKCPSCVVSNMKLRMNKLRSERKDSDV